MTALSLPRARVQPLVGELTSHKWRSEGKKCTSGRCGEATSFLPLGDPEK